MVKWRYQLVKVFPSGERYILKKTFSDQKKAQALAKKLNCIVEPYMIIKL